MTVIDPSLIEDRTINVRLADGTALVLRPLTPDDTGLLAAGFERLSPDSRYRRFFSPVPRLTGSLLRLLTDVDGINHFAWVALLCEDGHEVAVGVSRYIRLSDWRTADVAVSVIDDYQGRGIGSLLIWALADEAFECGVTRFEGLVLSDNQPMVALLGKAGAHFHHEGLGVRRFEIDLPARVQQVQCRRQRRYPRLAALRRRRVSATTRSRDLPLPVEAHARGDWRSETREVP